MNVVLNLPFGTLMGHMCCADTLVLCFIYPVLSSSLILLVFLPFFFPSFPVVGPTPDNPLLSVILVSLLPLLLVFFAVVAMFYWYRAHRRRMHNQEWESSIKKRKPKGGLDCSDACAIMMDDDRSDSSSTHANNLNHNTEPLPIELDLLVHTYFQVVFCQGIPL